MPEFIQGKKVRDYIFQIIEIQPGNNLPILLGTAFLIGCNGYAITAGHVVTKYVGKIIFGMFAREDCSWVYPPISIVQINDNADIALLKILSGRWMSPHTIIDSRSIHAGIKYCSFGYPDDSAYDIVIDGKSFIRPDLVFTNGYIRRRIQGSIPSIKGNMFFELSDIAGPGYSGSPVFREGILNEVIGIYVLDKASSSGVAVSYALT
ncbi:MAG: S1 family peptidase [Leptospirales bacterium]